MHSMQHIHSMEQISQRQFSYGLYKNLRSKYQWKQTFYIYNRFIKHGVQMNNKKRENKLNLKMSVLLFCRLKITTKW